MGVDDQPGFDPRLAWAAQGGTRLALACPVLVVVDVLRFTTAVEVAVTSGARVVPERWPGAGSPASAGEEPGRRVFSLSPASLAGVAAGELRHNGSLRPAVEDLVGAGAVLDALGGHPSPEARAAVAAFLDAAPICRPSWPAAPPAASWPPAAWPPTSAWRPPMTSAGRSPAWRAEPSLS